MLSLLELALYSEEPYNAEYIASQMTAILYDCMIKGALST